MAKLIVGNWKMNPQTYKEAEDLVNAILQHAEVISKAEVVLCPPFTWLTDFSHKNTSPVLFGAQNMFYEEKGAYTGEISPQMLKSSKVDYVIIGHSERRKYFGETNEIISKKIAAAKAVGLKAILCVGENEGEDRNSVLEKQLAGVSDVIVAYEPVWAIGTGKNCQPEDVREAATFIKKIVGDVRVIYGGSVNSQNAKEYLEIVDGLLPGGASLKADEFVKIVESASV